MGKSNRPFRFSCHKAYIRHSTPCFHLTSTVKYKVFVSNSPLPFSHNSYNCFFTSGLAKLPGKVNRQKCLAQRTGKPSRVRLQSVLEPDGLLPRQLGWS